jgi:methylglyoxal synthase
MEKRTMSPQKRIALVAHDFKKDDILEWVLFNKETLAKHSLYATGTTGRIIQENTGIHVNRLLSGPLGGDQQIGGMIAEGKIDMLFFFWDPMAAQPHDPDIKALLRLGVVWNIPMACDRATADFLISSPLMHTKYETQLTEYTEYLKRDLGKRH